MSNENRIQNIKGNLFPSRNSYENMTKLLNSDLEWLFEQAEKVEQLKKENWALHKEIGAYSTYVSDIAELNERLAKHTRLLANKMLNE